MKFLSTLRHRLSFGMAALLIFFSFLPAPVMASESYTLKLTATAGHTYQVFQILKGDVETLDGKTVLTNVEWGSGFDSQTFLPELQKIEGFESVTTPAQAAKVLENLDAADVRDAAVELAKLCRYNGATMTDAASDGHYEASGLSGGFYLIKDADGTLADVYDAHTQYLLKVVGNVDAVPKSGIPSVEKKVLEDSYDGSDEEDARYGEHYNDVADASIGDTLSFRLYANLFERISDYSAYTLIFHDTLSEGIDFLSIDSVILECGETEQKLTDADYTFSDAATDGCSFELTVSDLVGTAEKYGLALDQNSRVIVTYKARLNQKAVIGLNGNTNRVALSYSNNPNGKELGRTTEDEVIVFTYGLEITKRDGEDEDRVLEDARFVLKNDAGYALVTDGKFSGYTAKQEDASVLATGKDGKVKVEGLDQGEWKLIEIKAPTGYNLGSPVDVTISAGTVLGQSWTSREALDALTSLVVTVGDDARDGELSTGLVGVNVFNYKGFVLPETGLGGTTMLILSGLALVSISAILILRQTCKRKS